MLRACEPLRAAQAAQAAQATRAVRAVRAYATETNGRGVPHTGSGSGSGGGHGGHGGSGGGSGDGGPAPKMKAKLVYREIFPPMIRVLAYSTGAYFAMHLAWVLLKSEEEKRVQSSELGDLRDEIRACQGAKSV